MICDKSGDTRSFPYKDKNHMNQQNHAFNRTLLLAILPLLMLPSFSYAQSPAQHKLVLADTLAQNRKYQEAAILFEEVRANDPDAFKSIHAMNLAALYAIQRDTEKHKILLQWQQQKFADSNKPTDIERIEKAFLIAPYYKEEARLEKSLQRSQHAIDQGGSDTGPFQITKGIAHFHLNHFDEALALFSKSTDHKNPALRAQALAYTAAINARQGNRTAVYEVIGQTKFALQEIPKDDWANAIVATLALNHAQRFLATTGNAANSPRPAGKFK